MVFWGAGVVESGVEAPFYLNARDVTPTAFYALGLERTPSFVGREVTEIYDIILPCPEKSLEQCKAACMVDECLVNCDFRC